MASIGRETFFPSGEIESHEEIIDAQQGKVVRRRWYRNGRLFSEAEFLRGLPELGVFVDGERQAGYCWFDHSGSLWKQL